MLQMSELEEMVFQKAGIVHADPFWYEAMTTECTEMDIPIILKLGILYYFHFCITTSLNTTLEIQKLHFLYHA